MCLSCCGPPAEHRPVSPDDPYGVLCQPALMQACAPLAGQNRGSSSPPTRRRSVPGIEVSRHHSKALDGNSPPNLPHRRTGCIAARSPSDCATPALGRPMPSKRAAGGLIPCDPIHPSNPSGSGSAVIGFGQRNSSRGFSSPRRRRPAGLTLIDDPIDPATGAGSLDAIYNLSAGCRTTE